MSEEITTEERETWHHLWSLGVQSKLPNEIERGLMIDGLRLLDALAAAEEREGALREENERLRFKLVFVRLPPRYNKTVEVDATC